MKYIKIMIFYLLLIILTLVIVLLSIKNNSNKKNEISDKTIIVSNESKNSIPNNISNKINVIEDNDIEILNLNVNNSSNISIENYSTIKNLIDLYFSNMLAKQSSNLVKMLAPSVVNNYKINEDNIYEFMPLNKIENKLQSYRVCITTMERYELNATNDCFFIKGNCRTIGRDDSTTFSLIIVLNKIEYLYNIYPSKYIINNIKNIKEYKYEEITNRSINTFKYSVKSDEEIVKDYFENYKEMLIQNKELAFEKLDNEYKRVRFNNIDGFKIYLNENIEQLSEMTISQYKVVNNSENVIYYCIDNNENYYIFKRSINNFMDYNVYMDKYTIVLDDEKEIYNNLADIDKAKYNVRKIISMINTKDYVALYSLLNTTFKENNYNNINDFKDYLISTFYNINKYEIEDYSYNSVGYYVIKCMVTNKHNSTEEKRVVFIIQLKENDMDFSFSFNIE